MNAEITLAYANVSESSLTYLTAKAPLTSGAVGERRDYPSDVVPLAFRPSKNKWINYDEVPELRGRRELTKEQMPTLVTVTDPTDARTARVVNVDDLVVPWGFTCVRYPLK
jgi:hypothetical protein